MIRSFHKQIVWMLALGILAAACPLVSAQKARLADITVSNTRDDLLLYVTLEGAFSPELKEVILSGVPATFSFPVKLNNVRNMWFDQEIADIEVTHTIRYDNLKKEFSVRRSWKNNDLEVTRSFEEAQKWMTRISSLKIIPLSRLEKGQHYQLRIKAVVNKQTLPFYLHYILFFISFWDLETDWYAIDFIY